MEQNEKRILYFQSLSPLTAFAEACFSLTPKVSLPKANALYLEIGGTQRLFGGEEGVLYLAENLASPFELEKRYVLNDRPEWAPALAIAPEVWLQKGQSQARLFQLPIDRIEYCGDPMTFEAEGPARKNLTAFMKRVGIRAIGDFARLSTAAVGRRFGKMGVELGEWVHGNRELVLPPLVSQENIRESLDADSISSLEELLFLLRQTLVRIEARLRGRALVARQIRLVFFLESRQILERFLDLSEPMQESQALLKLLKEFLSHQTWTSPLEKLEVEVSKTEPFTAGQLSLFDKGENRFLDLAQYVERLKNRFGFESVGFPDLQESYLPERSWKNVWPPPKANRVADSGNRSQGFPAPGIRPLFLFTPAKPCPAPRHCRLIPSENLATEWWEEGGDRSYFIAETPQGERLWVYWDCQRREWFLQGTFD